MLTSSPIASVFTNLATENCLSAHQICEHTRNWRVGKHNPVSEKECLERKLFGYGGPTDPIFFVPTLDFFPSGL